MPDDIPRRVDRSESFHPDGTPRRPLTDWAIAAADATGFSHEDIIHVIGYLPDLTDEGYLKLVADRGRRRSMTAAGFPRRSQSSSRQASESPSISPGALILNSALAGLGLAYLPQDVVDGHVKEGRLVRVLEDWCPPFPGYHLYYPSRRQPTPAFTLLLEAVRYRDGSKG